MILYKTGIGKVIIKPNGHNSYTGLMQGMGYVYYRNTEGMLIRKINYIKFMGVNNKYLL